MIKGLLRKKSKYKCKYMIQVLYNIFTLTSFINTAKYTYHTH